VRDIYENRFSVEPSNWKQSIQCEHPAAQHKSETSVGTEIFPRQAAGGVSGAGIAEPGSTGAEQSSGDESETGN
jgi:hypothetical protein